MGIRSPVVNQRKERVRYMCVCVCDQGRQVERQSSECGKGRDRVIHVPVFVEGADAMWTQKISDIKKRMFHYEKLKEVISKISEKYSTMLGLDLNRHVGREV